MAFLAVLAALAVWAVLAVMAVWAVWAVMAAWLTYKGMQEDDMSDNESTRFRPPHNIAQAVAERKVTRKKMHDLKALLQQPQSPQALQRIGRALKYGQDLQIVILQATAAHWDEDDVISLDD